MQQRDDRARMRPTGLYRPAAISRRSRWYPIMGGQA